MTPDTIEQHARMFPKLSEEHIRQLEGSSIRRFVEAGEVLFDRDTLSPGVFVILSGSANIIGVANGVKAILGFIEHGEFTGEVTQLSGRRSLVTCCTRERYEVLEIDRLTLRNTMQNDAALGDIFLRSFLLRRIYLISNAVGDAVLIGSKLSSDTLRLRSFLSRNGQAGSSSRIENYLGFPLGISGQELADRAFIQAEKFGAQISIAHSARKLWCEQSPFRVELDDGQEVRARTLIVASGSRYRKLDLQESSRFEGNGIFYWATQVEAPMCLRSDVAVVGGGNSAGQAAVFLAGFAKHVYLLVRGLGLRETMSRYLIARIENSPQITLLTHTKIEELEGTSGLERIRWRNSASGVSSVHEIKHLFMMTGADPNTSWLNNCLLTDEKHFVKTGAEVADRWPLARAPFPLETSTPGIFAVGDVRSSSTKRVASAVGEGSMAIQFLHQVLAVS